MTNEKDKPKDDGLLGEILKGATEEDKPLKEAIYRVAHSLGKLPFEEAQKYFEEHGDQIEQAIKDTETEIRKGREDKKGKGR